MKCEKDILGLLQEVKVELKKDTKNGMFIPKANMYVCLIVKSLEDFITEVRKERLEYTESHIDILKRLRKLEK